ncbi:hypothetical protein H5410_055782, partial [Solanum commersonii]
MFARFRVRMSELCPSEVGLLDLGNVQFGILRVRAFGERTQEKGEEEKQDSPRTTDFGYEFAKELTLQ